MQIFKPNRWWFVMLALLFCWACTEDIDLDQKRKKKIVVNCVLTTDSVQTLTLTYSNPLNQHYYDEVETATATLYLDSVEVGQFAKTAYSKWELKHRPKFEGEYRLTVQVPGWDDIEATTTMPLPVWVEKSEGDNTRNKRHLLQRFAPSPYWMFVIGQSKDTIMVKPVVQPGDFLRNSIGTSHPNRDGFNAIDEMTDENSGTTRRHTIYLRINTPIENKEKEIPFYLESAFSTSLVIFRSASPEYDQYMKSSVQKMIVHEAFDDPTRWFDENEIYTNITNGLGVFGAYSERIMQCHYFLDNLPEHD
jgi:hypothetical protein